MMNIYISLRGKGRNYKEIAEERDKIFQDYLNYRKPYAQYINLIDSLYPSYIPNESNPIEYLGLSLKDMADADIILMPLDYIKSKGCKCELYVAKTYLKTIKSYIHTSDSTFFFEDFIQCYETIKEV